MHLIGNVIPDWVDVPREAGGGRRTVRGHRIVKCPCDITPDHEVRELDLGDRLYVSECKHKGFLWYRRKEECDEG